MWCGYYNGFSSFWSDRSAAQSCQRSSLSFFIRSEMQLIRQKEEHTDGSYGVHVQHRKVCMFQWWYITYCLTAVCSVTTHENTLWLKLFQNRQQFTESCWDFQYMTIKAKINQSVLDYYNTANVFCFDKFSNITYTKKTLRNWIKSKTFHQLKIYSLPFANDVIQINSFSFLIDDGLRKIIDSQFLQLQKFINLHNVHQQSALKHGCAWFRKDAPCKLSKLQPRSHPW